MIPANIKTFIGYNKIEDLLPDGNLINYKQIWSLRYEHYLDASGDLCNVMVLELTKDRNAYDIPIIKMIIERPRSITICPDIDIVQLSIDDYQIDGWEQGNLKVYDAEML